MENKNLLSGYCNGPKKVLYVKILKNNTINQEDIYMTEYIRHQIHHPENELNPKYTIEDLKKSIEAMRNCLLGNQ